MDLNNVFLIIGLLIILYYFLKWSNNYYRGTDVKYILPPFPYVGSSFKTLLGIEHMRDAVKNAYDQYPDEKYIGLFDSRKPLIMLRDVDLIKRIGIKDFDSFHDRRSFVDVSLDPLLGQSLLLLKGNVWREMRSTLSPAFSSSKMRNMFIYIEECAEEMAKFYINKCENAENQTIEIEVKDTFSRYTVDVIASTAFGIKTNSLEDKNNDFFKYGTMALSLSFTQVLQTLLFLLFPKLNKLLNIPLTRAKVSTFFRNIVSRTMKEREEKNIIRHDMIHLLMEARKGVLKYDLDVKNSQNSGFATVEESVVGKQAIKTKWQDDDFAAQAFLFFLGGFDTTSNTLTFFFYEICKQPKILEKLQKEIDIFISESKERLTFDDLYKLKYLDMCLSETLRIWPPFTVNNRICTKPFTLPPPNETSMKTYKVNKNDSIWTPIYALHHDEKYFPNSSQFDPERFSDENKASIEPGTYIPFGLGPRSCIGNRYALIVIKAIIFHMVANFDLSLSNKTENPLKLVNTAFNLYAKNGVWVNMKPRHKF